MNNDYSDIMNFKRPISKHPKMSLGLRAKQFSSFAALGNLDSNHLKPRKISSAKQIVNLSEDKFEDF